MAANLMPSLNMDRLKNIFINLKEEDVAEAAKRAFRGHSGKQEVIRYLQDFDTNNAQLFKYISEKKWNEQLSYRHLTIINTNGKVRKIDSPSLRTRILQHLLLNILEPIYNVRDNLNGLNCKKNSGITAKIKEKSVVKRLKHIFYDLRQYNYYLIVDQRKCYEHITRKVFRQCLKEFISDKVFIDYATDVCFAGNTLPIGTPTSPLAHHLIMYRFDEMCKSMTKASVRYADNCFLAFETKEEANSALWRIKNYWWYKLGIRAKKHSIAIRPMDFPCDFCGYVFHRFKNKNRTSHNKGYVLMRQSIVKRAMKCRNSDSWASYFGLMQHSDSFNLMNFIEDKMKLNSLTQKIKINRHLDAKNIEIKELLDKQITIYDYELRYNSHKEANWIKCLVGIEEVINEEKTGKIEAREFHGNYQGIIQFILECEKVHGKRALLPIEEVQIENQCGYIFRNSTNQIHYIDEIN